MTKDLTIILLFLFLLIFFLEVTPIFPEMSQLILMIFSDIMYFVNVSLHRTSYFKNALPFVSYFSFSRIFELDFVHAFSRKLSKLETWFLCKIVIIVDVPVAFWFYKEGIFLGSSPGFENVDVNFFLTFLLTKWTLVLNIFLSYIFC